MTSCKSVKVTFCNYLLINTKPPFVRKTYNTQSWLFRHFITEEVALFRPFCWPKNGFCWLKSPKIAIMMYGRFVFFAQRRDTKRRCWATWLLLTKGVPISFTPLHKVTFTLLHEVTFSLFTTFSHCVGIRHKKKLFLFAILLTYLYLSRRYSRSTKQKKS